MMPRYFVYLSSQTGPQPQIWHDGAPTNGEGKERYQPLFKRLLDASEASLDLAALSLKYPVPVNV